MISRDKDVIWNSIRNSISVEIKSFVLYFKLQIKDSNDIIKWKTIVLLSVLITNSKNI
jgi:hypothetical protein